MAESLLPIYLNDHLAGSTVGIELARRASRSNRESPEFGAPLERICEEIEADKVSLEEVMTALDVRRLYLGISGKLRLWSLLSQRTDAALKEFDLPQLAARAERQRTEVESLQSAAAKLI
jgi:hypothetical protein